MGSVRLGKILVSRSANAILPLVGERGGLGLVLGLSDSNRSRD